MSQIREHVRDHARDQVREYDTITVTPCTPHIGAEIGNIDLTRPLSNRQVEEVHDAIIAHGVIFFRGQKIDFESHARLVRYFGEPHIHVGGKGTASKTIPGYPAIRKQYFDKADSYPISVHPVVIRHPESGRKVLFVNREFTSHINEVPAGESRGVLEFL